MKAHMARPGRCLSESAVVAFMSSRANIAEHFPIGRRLALMPALGLLQMSGLDPQLRARRTRDGDETGASRQSQPGVLSKGLASFLKTPLEHESFKTAGNVEHNAGVCAPLLDAHVFPAIVESVMSLTPSRPAAATASARLVSMATCERSAASNCKS